MLKVNCTIVSLNLAQNPLGDAGAVDVSTALKKNATLISLKSFHESRIEIRDVRGDGERIFSCQRTSRLATEGEIYLHQTSQRTNFVNKLEKLSESELRQLHDDSVVENAAKFSNEKVAAGLSTLRHYAAIEQYAPLKRLLWCFEVGGRHKELVESSNNKRYTTINDDDDEDIWDYPLAQ
ncbi:unnamed protein product [Phytophthora fragariaefolia]|uniref:Unnamed protein product n=1 Tax=Phytophthora fragariaefolia TaxID=1490495 RepID=A0A9W6Y4D3_9STRA|nr:unnamed protein product [Phytophthora fragariaefolia]